MIERSQVFSVSEVEEGMRLDRWIKKKFPDIAHSLVERLLRKGKILLNDHKILASKRVSVGE